MPTNYKGDKNKLVSSDYLYNQLKIYNLIISDKIKDIYSLTSQMKYSTVATYADLQAVDLEKITNVTIMNVQKDETHLDADGNPLVCLYLVFPRMSDTEPPTMTFIGSLNMSQAVIQKMLEKALFIWIPEHYEQSTDSAPNALEVVADDATLTDGQIKLSDVTPVLPNTYVPKIGDYVLLVEEKNSNVPKFVTRNEINVTTVGKFSSQVENEGTDDEKEILLWNGKKIEAESVDTITKDETKVITSGGVYNGLYVEKTQTVIDTPAYYSVCQSTDTGALNVVTVVTDGATQILLNDINTQTTPEDLSTLTGDGTEYVKHIAEVNHEETYDEEKYALKDDTYTKTEVNNKITEALSGGIQVMEETEWNTYFNALTITAKDGGN